MPGLMSFVHVARWYSIPPLYATYSKLTPWFAKKAYLDPKALYMALTKIKFNVPKKTKRTIIKTNHKVDFFFCSLFPPP